jgi:hypothetical protein
LALAFARLRICNNGLLEYGLQDWVNKCNIIVMEELVLSRNAKENHLITGQTVLAKQKPGLLCSLYLIIHLSAISQL